MVVTLYKLTSQDNRTHGNTLWGENVTHTATGDELQDLCSDAWIHAYEHPLLAVLLNPIHAGFKNPKLWEARGEIRKRDRQLKCGCRTLTTVREIQLPQVTGKQKVRFAIFCTLEVCDDPGFVEWAHNWLTEGNISQEAARHPAFHLCERFDLVRDEGPRAAAWVARAAGAWAADAARAEAAAWAATWAVAARSSVELDLISIAEKALSEE